MTDVAPKKPDPSLAPPAPADAMVRQAELVISFVLRAGVTASLALVVTGLVVTFVRHREFLHDPSQLRALTRPGAAFPLTLGEIARGVAAVHGRAIIMAGLLLLIATPVLRVAVSIVTFVYERDRTFVVITSVVLALLILSFLLGHAGV